MFAYEASRPSATTTTAGTGNGWHRSKDFIPDQPAPPAGTTLDKTPACSAQGRVPWFNISGPEAQHVCREMGGRLCQNNHWKSACSVSGCNWSFNPTSTCNNFASLCAGSSCVCNLGPYDFSVTTAGNQDGLLPTAWAGASPPAIQSTCRTVHSGGSIYDLTGNLRELTCPGTTKCVASTSNFVLMGGAFSTADPTGEGARCNFTFYNVDASFKLFDVGFRCCFDTNPS
jgi:hypothetical protein